MGVILLVVRSCFEESKEGKPDSEDDESSDFVGLLNRFIHLGRNRSGAKRSGEVEVAELILHSEKGSTEAEADGRGVESAGEGTEGMGDGEGGSDEVENDPEPSVLVFVLSGVVDLKVGKKEPKSGDEVAGDFHGSFDLRCFCLEDFYGVRVGFWSCRERFYLFALGIRVGVRWRR